MSQPDAPAATAAGVPTKNRHQLRLAIYGKGGIGKSTVAANLSAAFAESGASVLQIGCDPKHDSTRLLLSGRRTKTVLEHLENPRNQADLIKFRRKALSPGQSLIEVVEAGLGVPDGLTRDEVLQRGFGGCLCIEAGGPKPGVGCAGRGILSTFELLGKLKVCLDDFAVVIYDVLGDVVCGGFGVPMRHEHANAILLVTSEEYMPIFAANNILRGVRNFDRSQRRLAGLFLNRRDNAESDSQVRTFSEHVGLPVIAELLRSPLVQQADQQGKTLIAAFAQSSEAAVFRKLAEHLRGETRPVYEARPVSDEELERIVLGRRPGLDRPVPATPRAETADASESKAVRQTRRLAVYGKGGIGKSTVSANLSASLAARGLRVLQIGCDPKHDSTRLLLGGRRVRTVLESLRDVRAADQRLADVVHAGAFGVDCVEIGGPDPGVGCAGRGLLSAFNLLEKLGLRESDYDAIIYDVLGDVVCGGFAIPVRKGYADSVLLVTSEEYMPIYAANNILRGINGAAGPGPKMLGVFHNARGPVSGFAPVEHFTQAVHLPIIARLERSRLVQEAERAAQPLVQFAPEAAETQIFAALGACLHAAPVLHPAAPVSDERLEELVLGRVPEAGALAETAAGPATEAVAEVPGSSTFATDVPDLRFCGFEHPPTDPFYYRIKPIRPPIMGCAFQSAARTALRVRDAVVVIHGPRSCAFMCRGSLGSNASKSFRRNHDIKHDLLAPNLVCTDMAMSEMIHGGTELLVETLRRVLAEHPPVVYLSTACPPAIIGDDIADAIRQAQPTSPQTRIIPLRSDGNMSGGGLNGMLSGLFDGIVGLFDKEPAPEKKPMTVNLICDWEHDQTGPITRILGDVGISINTAFTVDGRDPRAADLRRFHAAPLTLMGPPFYFGVQMYAKFLKERFGTTLGRYSFPRGLRETELWLRDIGAFFGIQERVEAFLAPHREAYEQTLAECRPVLVGKRIVAFSRGLPTDWAFDVMAECGMEVAFVGVTASPEDLPFVPRHSENLRMEYRFHPDRRNEILERFKPDAVFTGLRHELPRGVLALDAVGVHEKDIGFPAGHLLARRWKNLFLAQTDERWRRDFVPVDKRQAPRRPLPAMAGKA